MNLFILFLLLSFFLGYTFQNRMVGKEKKIMVILSVALTLLYFNYLRFW